MRNRYLYITLLAILGFNSETLAQGAHAKSAPRLVVNITIDQLRSDYLEAFAPLYSEKGFKRLMDNGCLFTSASYPFAPVDRASAIASLTTGVTPYYNNIIGEQWLNRQTLRPMTCVDDTKWSGLMTSDASSPEGISTSTLGDELKMITSGKAVVYAIAPFRDAAVLSAGHAADGALWIDDKTGNWCSTTYYFKTLPSWASAFNSLQGPAKIIGNTTWEPFNSFVGTLNYFMKNGEETSFKHKFSDIRKYQQYKTSALVNADITSLAQQCIAATGMGLDKVTDMLSLTYYAGQFDHRPLTECQTELEDTYVRLDHELERLIDYLEERLGKQQVLVVLTSTGYCDPESTDYGKYRIPSGTFQMDRTANLLNMYLGAIWGQGIYVEATFRNQIFLNHKLLENRKISIKEATGRAQEILTMMSGVRNVYTALQLITSQNPQLEKIRNGFNPEHCGDILIEVAPGWEIQNENAVKLAPNRSAFTQFPIIFYGCDVQAETIKTPVTTDRIAPTLARAIRIRAPNACAAEPLF